MKKILVVFGTRPEAIKLCPLVLELRKYPEKFEVLVCVTAQHREMLDQVLTIFRIEPDFDLNLMKSNQSLSDITTSCLSETGQIIRAVCPDLVIVQGDTTTTFATSLAAFYHKIPLGHVEAGLRTHNKYSPFPEEINRKLTTAIGDIHFAPTESNKNNLVSEGIDKEKIIITGNTVIDSLFWVLGNTNLDTSTNSALRDIDFTKKIILVTGHRRENFGQGFINVCNALKEIADRHNDILIVFPVHLNPNVRKPVNNILSTTSNIILLEPLDYEAFVFLLNQSYLVISDSGGIQEEAPSLGKPVLITRDNTERPEAVDAGTVVLVGTDIDRIVTTAEKLITNTQYYKTKTEINNPYGDGEACFKIAKALIRWMNA